MPALTVKEVSSLVYIRQTWTSTHDIIRRVNTAGHLSSSVLDFTGTVTVLESAVGDPDTLYASPVSTLNSSIDNGPPIKINNAFVAGAHTLPTRIITKASHGLTNTAVGDVGADGAAKDWVIIEIVDTDNIRVAPQNTGTATDWIITGTITGSTITFTTSGAYAFTANAALPLALPLVQDYSLDYLVDGVVTADITTATDCDSFHMRESMGVPNLGSILSDLISDHPTATPKDINDSAIQTQVQIEMSWRFDQFGGRTSTYAWYNEQDYLIGTSDYIGGMQSNTTIVSPNTKKLLYVPDVGTVDGYTFKDKDDVTSNALNVEIAVSDCDDTSNPASHFAMLSANSSDVPSIGHVVGYRRNRGVGLPSERSNLCSNLIFTLSSSEKLYPAAISNGVQPSGGETYSVQTYDAFYDMAGRANYTVNACVEFSDEKVHWIFDCHTTLASTWVALPSVLVGRPARLLNASDSFTLHSKTVQSNGLQVSVSGGYGHAVIEIDAMSAIRLWKGAVESSGSSPSGNEIREWKGALEPLGAASAFLRFNDTSLRHNTGTKRHLDQTLRHKDTTLDHNR